MEQSSPRSISYMSSSSSSDCAALWEEKNYIEDPQSMQKDYKELGIHLMTEKRYEEALLALTAQIQSDSSDYQAYRIRSRIHMELHNFSKAIRDIRRASELHPMSSQDDQRSVAHYYNHLYAHLNSQMDQTSSIDRLPFEDQALSPLASQFYHRGLSFYYLNKFQDAINDFTIVLREEPSFAACWRCRGTAHFYLGQFRKAIPDLLQSNKLEPSATAYYNLGLAYGNLEQFGLAIKNFTQAISMNPQDHSTYNNRGISYKSLKQYENAIADFSVAISLKEDYASAYDHRAQCYAEMGETHKSLEDMSTSLHFQQTGQRYYRRSKLYWSMSQAESAIKDLDSAINLGGSAKDLATWYLQRGRYLVHQGEYEKAESDFGLSMKLTPDNAEVVYERYRVRITARLNDLKGAKEDYMLALSLDQHVQLAFKACMSFE